MDNQLNNPEGKDKASLNEDQQYQNYLIEKWAKSSSFRRTLLKSIPILLILFAIPLTIKLSLQQQNYRQEAATSGTNRYINTNTGADSGTGDIAHPWKTLKYSLEHSQANDVINLREGTYAGTGWVGGSNAAAAGVTIQNYPGENASIQSNSVNLLQLENWKNVAIKGISPGSLKFEGQWPAGQAGNKYGIFIYYADGQAGYLPTNILIDNVTIHGIAGYGISLGNTVSNNTNTGIGVNNSTIQNVDIYDTGTGIRMNHVGAGNIIQNNNIHDNTRLIANTPTPTNDDNGAVGIALDNTEANGSSKSNPAVTVKNNIFRNNSGISYDYGYDGGGVELYQSSYNLIENNTFDSNEGGIETGTSSVSTMPVTGNVIRYNVFYGKGNQNNKSPLMLFRAMKDGEVTNNTINLDNGNDVFRIQETTGGYSGVLDNLKITNNLIQVKSSNNAYALNKASFTAPGVEINKNFIYSNLSPTAIVADSSINKFAQNNLLGWQNATPYGDNDVWNQNPLFKDAASHDYKLSASSTAFGFGAFPTEDITPTPTLKPTNTPTPTLKPTSTPTPTIKPISTPTPTLRPTSTPTPEPTFTPSPTIKQTSTPTPTITLVPTVSPTPVLSPGQQKKCVKFLLWKFCF